jgi:hypothetical protein
MRRDFIRLRRLNRLHVLDKRSPDNVLAVTFCQQRNSGEPAHAIFLAVAQPNPYVAKARPIYGF